MTHKTLANIDRKHSNLLNGVQVVAGSNPVTPIISQPIQVAVIQALRKVGFFIFCKAVSSPISLFLVIFGYTFNQILTKKLFTGNFS